MLTPTGSKSSAQEVELIKCEQELSQWYDNLRGDCSYGSSEIKGSPAATQVRVLSLHRTVLSMIYSTTMSALHRPQILPELPSQAIARSLQQLSRRRVRDAATEIAEASQALLTLDLTRFLPPTGVSVLIPAIIVYLLEIKSGNSAARKVCSQRYQQCMRAFVSCKISITRQIPHSCS